VTDAGNAPTTPRPAASDLLRSLGLLVDGPVPWPGAVRSRAPGVFVVELPTGAAEAAFDHLALRRWLERLPQLLLDGQRPTVNELAQRLAQFWLPDEPVLFVGRSARALGPRLAALYATPLGDARPYAGGHWLKTLAQPSRMRIWWAETDAHEEYEDALLAEVAGRQPPANVAGLPDKTLVLPFANLADTAGRIKGHGLEGALRQPDEAATAASPSRGKPAAAGGQRRRATGRAASRSNSPPSTRSPTTARAADRRPEPTYVSQEGLDRLQTELEGLREGVRPGVIARVKAARELGDLRENAEYESARKEQSFVEGRIQALEAMLKTTVVVSSDPATESVAIGSTVVVEQGDVQQTFVLVGSSEADPAAGRISYGSPVGQALLGRRRGDEVIVRLPRGEVSYVVREVR